MARRQIFNIIFGLVQLICWFFTFIITLVFSLVTLCFPPLNCIFSYLTIYPPTYRPFPNSPAQKIKQIFVWGEKRSISIYFLLVTFLSILIYLTINLLVDSKVLKFFDGVNKPIRARTSARPTAPTNSQNFSFSEVGGNNQGLAGNNGPGEINTDQMDINASSAEADTVYSEQITNERARSNNERFLQQQEQQSSGNIF